MIPRSVKSRSCSWSNRRDPVRRVGARRRPLNVTGTYLAVIGAVQVVGHGRVLRRQRVDLRRGQNRQPEVSASGDRSWRHAHLFDPGLDAVVQPQLSGLSLVGAQDLTDLTVGEAVLLGLQQQILWYGIPVVVAG